MSFDPLIANPGRLRILTALATEPKQEFVQLRSTTRMTDGNLATHARRLHSAGLVEIDKQFRSGKPVTTILLTREGRVALETHVEQVMRALRPASEPQDLQESAQEVGVSTDQSEWID